MVGGVRRCAVRPAGQNGSPDLTTSLGEVFVAATVLLGCVGVIFTFVARLCGRLRMRMRSELLPTSDPDELGIGDKDEADDSMPDSAPAQTRPPQQGDHVGRRLSGLSRSTPCAEEHQPSDSPKERPSDLLAAVAGLGIHVGTPRQNQEMQNGELAKGEWRGVTPGILSI
jgi:hypothetical protein